MNASRADGQSDFDRLLQPHDVDGRVTWQRNEIVMVMGVLVAVFIAFQWHLRSVIISDMDEGTYLYAGQLIARGLVPYRDFLLAHPPAIALLAAACARVFGDGIMAARQVYLVLILASTVPLYLLVREIARSRLAALLSIVSYTAGMLLIANMGRTVRLEPLMNAFIVAAFACRYVRPSSGIWAVVMGAALASAAFVKVIAVVPAVLLLASDILFDRPFRPLARRWVLAGIGAAVVLLPTLLWCLSQPRFVQDVFLGQVHRPRIDVALRLSYLAQNFRRYPPALVGLLGAAYLAFRATDKRLRAISFVAIANTLVLVFAFKTFFAYYIVQCLPLLAVVFAIVVDQAGTRWLRARWTPVALALIAVLGLLAPLGYAETYERSASGHVAEPREILQLLRSDSGVLYTMYPAFGLWSGRPLYPWYYRADSLVPRINGWVSDKDFVDVFRGSTTLVLYPGELDDYPDARAYVRANFAETHKGAEWVVWSRRNASAAP
jgi:hypothetical protein